MTYIQTSLHFTRTSHFDLNGNFANDVFGVGLGGESYLQSKTVSITLKNTSQPSLIFGDGPINRTTSLGDGPLKHSFIRLFMR